MSYAWQVMKELLLNINLIFRLSVFEVKNRYMMHYLGPVWQILTPFIQIGIFWFVFGLGIRGGSPVGETPFFLWLIVGMVPWLFISPAITQSSKSVFSNIGLVSKMKFPVSTLPTIRIIENSFSFFFMLLLTILVLFFNDIFSGVYLLQLLYYLFCLYFLLLGLSLLLSTLTTIFRDIQNLIQATMRLMLFTLPILWDVEKLPEYLSTILKLNPFYYVIEGFRNALLGGEWFFEDLTYTFYFWTISTLILFTGASVHLKFRHKFVDYI